MSTEVEPSLPTLDDARHNVLRVVLRAQFAASGIGLICAVALVFAPENHLIFISSATVLAVLGVVMCAAVTLPLILLSSRDALAIALGTFALVSLAGVAHIGGYITIKVPIPFGPDDPNLWIEGLVTILTIAGPFAVLAGMLLRKYQEANSRSDQLVQDLRFEIEERQAALEALQQAEQRLTHTQKLELLGQLAGGLAHDMNNALTAIMGAASFLNDLAEESPRNEAEEEESRQIIMEYAQHAAQLTRQLLMLGRKDIMQPRPLDFGAEVKRAIASARRVIPSDIRVLEQYITEPATVQADPSQITQIVLNMVVNAKDAMLGGGELLVSVGPSPVSSSYVDLTIADTGHGIEAANLERIFEPFYSSKPAGMGTGLGLANVKDLVDELEGLLTVQSQLGVGTTFHVSFPLLDATPQEKAQPLAIESTSHNGGSILLVDDSAVVRQIATTMLERAGYDVAVAESGSEAIAWLTENDAVDLVITDVVMPDGGGADVINWLARARPHIPVLIISGYTEDEQVRRGMRTGEIPFVRKPFSIDDLVSATRKVLQNHS